MEKNITFAGVGALGSQIARNIAAPGVEMTFVDDDEVEPQNIGTSAYDMLHLGRPKVEVMVDMVKSMGVAKATARKMTVKSADELTGDLVIDTFDNPRSRGITVGAAGTVLHVGVSAEGTGVIYWDDVYKAPPIEFERGFNPVCTNALGRPLLRFTSAVAAGIIEHYLKTGEKRSVVVTKDMRVIE